MRSLKNTLYAQEIKYAKSKTTMTCVHLEVVCLADLFSKKMRIIGLQHPNEKYLVLCKK